MRILVTGGAGYLGSVLSMHLLERGLEVRVLDTLLHGGRSLVALIGHNSFEFLRGDVRDKNVVQTALQDVDSVVHLAAIVGDPACAREPDLAKAVNVQASVDLIEAARDAGVRRLVFASTCSNYGQLRDASILATEDHELRPVSLYAETKVAVERRLLEGPTNPLEAVVLRLGTLYGVSPRMRFDLTVNEFSMEMFVNRKLVVYGERLWRPYVHVWDAARAIAAVLTASSDVVAGQVFNVGDSGQNFRKLDLVEIIRKRVGEVDVQFVHKPTDPRDFRVSFERIRDRLGYTISRRVPDGVDEVIKAIGSGILDDLKNPFYYNVKP